MWVNNFRRLSGYDSAYNLTSFIHHSWSGSSWVNGWREIYSYDGSGNQLTKLYETWSGSVWMKSTQNLYTYDGMDRLIENLLQEWDGSSWKDKTRSEWEYDSNGNLEALSFYSSSGAGLMPSVKYSHYYEEYTPSTNNSILAPTNFAIGPNPTNGIINVHYNGLTDGKIYIKVFDVTGGLVKECVDFGSNATFDISSLPSGMYHYMIISGEESTTGSLIKN